MNSINAPEFSRNYGFWDENEQEALMGAHVAIGGVGGDGYQVGLKLARMGVAEFSVADPEDFELENLNRVPGATHETIGMKKVAAFAADVYRINPEATVNMYPEGLNADNVDEFVSNATLTLDETELTKLELGMMLSDAAIRRGIPNMLGMNVGFAGQVTTFHPDGRYDFRDLMGLPDDMPLDEVAEQELDLSRCLPYVPSYVDLNTLKTVQTDPDAPLPSISPGVDIASAIVTSQAFLNIVRNVSPRRPDPVYAKHILWVDALTGKSDIAKHPVASHYYHLAKLVTRTALHLNAPTSFTTEDRKRRADAYAAEQDA